MGRAPSRSLAKMIFSTPSAPPDITVIYLFVVYVRVVSWFGLFGSRVLAVKLEALGAQPRCARRPKVVQVLAAAELLLLLRAPPGGLWL